MGNGAVIVVGKLIVEKCCCFFVHVYSVIIDNLLRQLRDLCVTRILYCVSDKIY
jgi:hypothetical protein